MAKRLFAVSFSVDRREKGIFREPDFCLTAKYLPHNISDLSDSLSC
jgi:hypothetical protein